MTNVVLFPSVLGVRRGVSDTADRLRQHGHDVLVADLYDGLTFDDYDTAMAYAHEVVGLPALMERAVDSAATVPDGFMTMGFSLGCVMAVHLATRRTTAGVLMVAGAIPVSAFGDGRPWPAGLPAQTHATIDDPWRDQDEIDTAVRDINAGGGTIEVFDYPGSGHLFTDPTLRDEYDPSATELFWRRALPFVAACG